MKADVFLSEVVETRETPRSVIEACASAEGHYDRAASQLILKLDAYLQDLAGEQFRPAWLPKCETVKEGVAHEEMRELGREVFQQWVKRVHAAVPREIPLTAEGRPDVAAAGEDELHCS